MSTESQFENARLRAEHQARDAEVEFREGFSARTVFGAIFVALIMLPGGLFLGLVAGQGIGEAAEWVTIVLFAEITRRSFKPLTKQEIYILFYIAASLTTAVAIDRGLAGGPFGELIWRAYTTQSPPFEQFAGQIPTWAVPGSSSAALLDRNLFHVDWLLPIGLLILVEACLRASWMGMGYVLFRFTSDVERLPFPTAPVAASGATALAEAGSKSEGWRWSVFSTGAVVGLVFGFFYIAIPVFTFVLFGESFNLFPIPFADMTKAVENVMPTALVGLSFSLGNFLMGSVLPWQIVVGSCLGSVVCQIALNPILHSYGMFPNWKGGNAFATKLAVDMDFWVSVGIGLNIAVAILGISLIVKHLMESRRNRKQTHFMLAPPKGRGDVPIWTGIGVWAIATLILIVVCRLVIPSFPIGLVLFFGLLWSPLNSYVSARMIALTGRGVGFPYLREVAIVGTGYKRLDVWYAPLPLNDFGWAAQRFREVELTGTKFGSLIKAELVMFPIVMCASFAYWAFFYRATALDGSQFPYAQAAWPFYAQSEAVWKTGSMPGETSQVSNVIKPTLIAAGTASGLVLYGVFSVLKLPLLAFYGFIGGVGLWPANTIPQAIGALVGRKYFARKFGEERWAAYAPVLLAGFSCGAGLLAMVAIAFALVARAVSSLPY